MDTLSIFQKYLQNNDIDIAFISSPVNITYLTGFKGVYPPSVLVGYFFNPDGFLVVPKKGIAKLVVDGRYEGAEHENRDKVKLTVCSGEGKNRMMEFCSELLLKGRKDRKNIGLEKLYLTYKEGAHFARKLSGNTIKDISDVLVNQRSLKTGDEIEKLKQAIKVTDETFLFVISQIKPGMVESEIGFLVEKTMKDKGCELSFPPIVASGPNSSVPHHVSGSRKIRKKDIILIDSGAKYMGYHADMTRTVFYGEPTSKQKEVYNSVLEAQICAENSIKPGMEAKTGFKFAADVLERDKLNDYFTHSLGHGVGLFIHESPKVSSESKDVFKPGHVFSVEPGVYLSGEFGVRIEDLVCVNDVNCTVLTSSPKELTVLGP